MPPPARPILFLLLGAVAGLLGLVLGLCLGARIGYAKAIQDDLARERAL